MINGHFDPGNVNVFSHCMAIHPIVFQEIHAMAINAVLYPRKTDMGNDL